MSELYFLAGFWILLFIVLGLVAKTEEGRQIDWSIAAAGFVVASLIAYATN